MLRGVQSERGSIVVIGAVLMVFLVLGIAMTYFGSQRSSDNGFAVKQVDLTASTAPKPKVPESPSPFASIKPNLPPLPELSLAATFPQQQFKEKDFPFSFYIPNYFLTEKIELEQHKAEFLEKNPGSKWYLLSQTRVGVPMDDSLYDYHSCTNYMTIFLSKYSNEDKLTLAKLIEMERATYPGSGVMATYETYKKSLSQVSYPRPNSYLFDGIISENKVKELYFEYGDFFYSAFLLGGCNTGEGYSPQADALFTSLMQNLKFE